MELKAAQGPSGRTRRHRGPTGCLPTASPGVRCARPRGLSGSASLLRSEARPAGEEWDPLHQRFIRGGRATHRPRGTERPTPGRPCSGRRRRWGTRRTEMGTKTTVSLGFPVCEGRAAKRDMSAPSSRSSHPPPPGLPRQPSGRHASCVGGPGTTSEARRREPAHLQLLRPGRPKWQACPSTAPRRPAVSCPEASNAEESGQRGGVSGTAGLQVLSACARAAQKRAGRGTCAHRAAAELPALDTRPLRVLTANHAGRILTQFSRIRKHGAGDGK